MDDVKLPKATARGLRAHITTRRREIVASIAGVAWPQNGRRPVGAGSFASALLDRMQDELRSARCAETDRWLAEVAQDGGQLGGGVIGVALALVAASYASRHADGHIVARYLAVRGRELDRAVEDALRGRRGRSTPDELVESLLASLQARDAATCDHSRAVGGWAARIAAAYEMKPEEQRFVEVCAVLHDIGKMATPEAILLKPGALDDDEWSTMREHSAAGARILDRLPTLRSCAPVVRAHHEQVDGKGYPDGLAGNAIPVAARIIAVCDAFHAMISNRPYRAAISPAHALRVLSEGKGVRWDLRAVEAMHGIIRVPRRVAEERAAV